MCMYMCMYVYTRIMAGFGRILSRETSQKLHYYSHFIMRKLILKGTNWIRLPRMECFLKT